MRHFTSWTLGLAALLLSYANTASSLSRHQYRAVLRLQSGTPGLPLIGGRAEFSYRQKADRMTFRLRLKLGEQFTTISLHCGTRGDIGPAFAILAAAPSGGWHGKVLLASAITPSNLNAGSVCAGSSGREIGNPRDLAAAMDAGEIRLLAPVASLPGTNYAGVVRRISAPGETAATPATTAVQTRRTDPVVPRVSFESSVAPQSTSLGAGISATTTSGFSTNGFASFASTSTVVSSFPGPSTTTAVSFSTFPVSTPFTTGPFSQSRYTNTAPLWGPSSLWVSSPGYGFATSNGMLW